MLINSASLVPQDVYLFSGTIAENIAADEALDRGRVLSVLEEMGVAELLLSRPLGLDAPVLGQGSNFSAGERQLLAFARALYRDAPFIILDEATANVDSETEARLKRATEVLLQGRTAIVVAHRLSTIASASQILVLKNGSVAERGTHEELLQLDGVYRRLYELQLKGENLRT